MNSITLREGGDTSEEYMSTLHEVQKSLASIKKLECDLIEERKKLKKTRKKNIHQKCF